MKESMYLLTYETDKGSERYILKRASYVNGTKETIRKKGFQFVSVEKVYPINMERYGHDFDHVATMCSNAIHEMENGNMKYDESIYDLRNDAERFAFESGGRSSIVWLNGKDYSRAKEIIGISQASRMKRCLEAGVPYVG